MDKIFSCLKRYRRIFVCLGLALACFAASALVYFSAVRPFAGKCFSVKICDSYENFTPIETQVSQTFTTSFDVMNLTFMFQIPGEQHGVSCRLNCMTRPPASFWPPAPA